MEERCGECGTENEGPALNRFPWYVGIKEKVKYEDGGRPSKKIKLGVLNVQTFTTFPIFYSVHYGLSSLHLKQHNLLKSLIFF